jgi:hypothetical protein
MRISGSLVLICALLAFTALSAGATEPVHTKLLPYSVSYPLISPMPFPAPPGDSYRESFNVRRLFKGVSGSDYADTLLSSVDWFSAYGGYGVIGHGADVFTNRAALWRMRYRGR